MKLNIGVSVRTLQGVFDVRFHCRGLNGSGDVAVQALRLPDAAVSTSVVSGATGRRAEPRRPRIVPRSSSEAGVPEATASNGSVIAVAAAAQGTGPTSMGAAVAGEGPTETVSLERWRITHASVETKKVTLPFQLRPDDVIACPRSATTL